MRNLEHYREMKKFTFNLLCAVSLLVFPAGIYIEKRQLWQPVLVAGGIFIFFAVIVPLCVCYIRYYRLYDKEVEKFLEADRLINKVIFSEEELLF